MQLNVNLLSSRNTLEDALIKNLGVNANPSSESTPNVVKQANKLLHLPEAMTRKQCFPGLATTHSLEFQLNSRVKVETQCNGKQKISALSGTSKTWFQLRRVLRISNSRPLCCCRSNHI